MREQIVHLLKSRSDFLSGEEISREFNISRAGIWKNIQDLRQKGYDIEAVPHKGYRLVSIPDLLLSNEVLCGLHTKYVGKKIYYFDKLDTTMKEAFRLGMEGEKEGTIVIAEQQSHGKGRLGRIWESPKGKGIYMSLLLCPQLPLTEVPLMTLMSAVAICDAVRTLYDVVAEIKWPNDLLINGKKISGILTELNAESDRVKFLVIGVGINVNTTKSHLPEKATSLKLEIGKKIDRIKLLQIILEKFEFWYEQCLADGFDGVLQQWKTWSCTLGREIVVSDGHRQTKGKAMDLDSYGRLIIKQEDGNRVAVMTGDVTLLKK